MLVRQLVECWYFLLRATPRDAAAEAEYHLFPLLSHTWWRDVGAEKTWAHLFIDWFDFRTIDLGHID